MFFIIIICLLSWYHWSEGGEWLDEAREKLSDLRKKRFLSGKKGSQPDTPSGDDAHTLDDDEDSLSVIEELEFSEGIRSRKTTGQT